jgi:hypothetical protein
MEAFELTFYCRKEEYDQDITNILSVLYRTLDEFHSFGKECKIKLYSEEDKDYVEIELYIFGFVLKENTFLNMVKNIADYITIIFRNTTAIRFATGIYELTYYHIENIAKLASFNDSLFQKFPFVFFRPGQREYQGRVLFEDDYSVCIYNKDAQGLF